MVVGQQPTHTFTLWDVPIGEAELDKSGLLRMFCGGPWLDRLQDLAKIEGVTGLDYPVDVYAGPAKWNGTEYEIEKVQIVCADPFDQIDYF